MIDFSNFTPADLRKIGIRFQTAEEAQAFYEVVKEEMEVRVGRAISDGRTEKELEEFEDCETDEEMEAWLNAHCPHFRTIIQKAGEQMEKELIEYKDQIPGVIKDSDESATAGQTTQPGTDQTEKHIQDAQRAMRKICAHYRRGALSEGERQRRMTDCFCTYYLDYLIDRNLRIRIDPAQWPEFREAFLKYKSDSSRYGLPGQSWLIYSRNSADKGTRHGDEATEQEKKDVIRLMDAFHIPVDYYEPVPADVKCPDDSHSVYDPDHCYVGWGIWKDDGGLLREDFRLGSTIELTDHYGLKARIQVNDKIDDKQGKLNGGDHYAGVGTVEGYTGPRPRVIDIFTRNGRIDCLRFKKEADDAGHPIWEPYNEYTDKKQKIQDQILKDNIEAYSADP